ncbi:GNAT family N-acetyltransferase [Rhodocytophaga rosea]|uniref:GNAT family N-acetyltransferase n=1 Tax=Rhodocytophaga rosea TaxID=2704465 RepID=A0A6C0GUS7_9BACT|nr:GNAT family protein [Rhodocytophaga rosea]QHT71564.1 GNAT family N-acetyltransferase [Rhodocytophaga rosea]
MKLLPIGKTLEDNQDFLAHPDCCESLSMSVDFYNRIGFNPPWIGYYAQQEGKLVGAAGYKGKPVNNTVEIAYGTFPAFRGKGIGTQICRELVLLALQTDPMIRITARTLPENNESASILKKNGFVCLGTIWDEDDGNVWDEDDGNVWEWEYQKTPVTYNN